MTNDINIQKLKSEYPEFFEQISPDLLEFIFSKETSSKIAQICLENEIEDEEKIEKIAYRVTLALLNEVPKENLAEIFEKGVDIDPETAKKISIEIKRLIFSRIPEIQPRKIQKEEAQIEKNELIQPAKPSPPAREKEKPEKPSKKDAYREPIE